MYSNTSEHATGSALYQVQDGSPRLIAYMSNYSITELEICGFAINVASFAHLLKRVDFDAVVDHQAIMHIMRSKAEPATNRIKRLLEILSSYSFNLYYVKGKDMVLSDFLLRQHGDDSNPHEIIPISFNMGKILKQNCQNHTKDTFLVQTRFQSKTKKAEVPDVCSSTRSSGKTRKETKPIIIDNTPTIVDVDSKTGLGTWSQNVTMTKTPNNMVKSGIRGAVYPDPIARSPPRPPKLTDKRTELRQNIGPTPNLDFEENSPHQEGIISEIYVSLDQSYFEKPQELIDLVDTSKLVQKYLPKQTDIDKILHIIKRKVLKGTHLPLTIKEIQAGYLNSLYFKDIYKYLTQNELPSKRHAIQKIETLSERFILLDSLLFKLITTPGKEKALLAIPEVCADTIITLYHASLFAGHQGVIKTYLTISDKFFIPNLMHYLRSYLKACHICQLVRNEKLPSRQLETRIHLNYRPMSRLSMDLKVMPRWQKGHCYILCLKDEMTNYLVTAPLYQVRSEKIGEALIENVISKFGMPEYIIMD